MVNNKIYFLLLISFLLTDNIYAEIKSLKNNKTNVRLGPDISYPIKWEYKKKYLPVQIIIHKQYFLVKTAAIQILPLVLMQTMH